MTHATKHYCKGLSRAVDTETHSLDVSVYSSGGVLHSAYFVIHDDDGRDLERWTRSAHGAGGITEVIDQAVSAFTDPDSIYNQPVTIGKERGDEMTEDEREDLQSRMIRAAERCREAVLGDLDVRAILEADEIGLMMEFLDVMGFEYGHFTELPDDQCHEVIRAMYRQAVIMFASAVTQSAQYAIVQEIEFDRGISKPNPMITSWGPR